MDLVTISRGSASAPYKIFPMKAMRTRVCIFTMGFACKRDAKRRTRSHRAIPVNYCGRCRTQIGNALDPVLALKNIRKSYGGVPALKDGNLTVSAGEVHLLLGENGAGKSTLMKIVAGMVESDGGEMLWNSRSVNVRTPGEAAAIGIAMVHQESLLAPHLTVAENIFLGRDKTNSLGGFRRSGMIEQATRLIDEHQFPLRPEW